MKLRFLTPRDTPLASVDTGLIESLRRELLGRAGIAETDSIESADALVIHEPWAFREWRHIDRLMADPVVGRFPHKVFTVNSDDAASGLLRGVYTCLRRSRFDHKLHVAAPFLAQPNELVAARAGTKRAAPTLLGTWRGNPKSNRRVRGGLIDLWGQSELFKVESTDSWLNHGAQEKAHYVQLLRSGKFSLCPGGWAPASIRIYESMGLGVAPVLIADEFVEPDGPDWPSVAIRIKEADLPALDRLLLAREDEYIALGEGAYAAWKQHFHPDLLIGYYADALLKCMRANIGTSSPQEEFARWRSRRMYLSNGWTLPQRVQNRVRRMLHPQ